MFYNYYYKKAEKTKKLKKKLTKIKKENKSQEKEGVKKFFSKKIIIIAIVLLVIIIGQYFHSNVASNNFVANKTEKKIKSAKITKKENKKRELTKKQVKQEHSQKDNLILFKKKYFNFKNNKKTIVTFDNAQYYLNIGNNFYSSGDTIVGNIKVGNIDLICGNNLQDTYFKINIFYKKNKIYTEKIPYLKGNQIHFFYDSAIVKNDTINKKIVLIGDNISPYITLQDINKQNKVLLTCKNKNISFRKK